MQPGRSAPRCDRCTACAAGASAALKTIQANLTEHAASVDEERRERETSLVLLRTERQAIEVAHEQRKRFLAEKEKQLEVEQREVGRRRRHQTRRTLPPGAPTVPPRAKSQLLRDASPRRVAPGGALWSQVTRAQSELRDHQHTIKMLEEEIIEATETLRVRRNARDAALASKEAKEGAVRKLRVSARLKEAALKVGLASECGC